MSPDTLLPPGGVRTLCTKMVIETQEWMRSLPRESTRVKRKGGPGQSPPFSTGRVTPNVVEVYDITIIVSGPPKLGLTQQNCIPYYLISFIREK